MSTTLKIECAFHIHKQARGRKKVQPGELPMPICEPGRVPRVAKLLALAHRGSSKVRLGILQQMLDESFLRANFLLERPGGAQTPDEPMIYQTIQAALQALVQLHKRQPKLDLSGVTPALDTLAKSGNITVRTEAARVKQALPHLLCRRRHTAV